MKRLAVGMFPSDRTAVDRLVLMDKLLPVARIATGSFVLLQPLESNK